MHSDMTPHEQRAWKEIEDWKAGKLQVKDRLPAPVRAALAKSKSAAAGASHGPTVARISVGPASSTAVLAEGVGVGVDERSQPLTAEAT